MNVGQPETFSEGRGLSDLDKQTDSSEENEIILINLSPRAEREAEQDHLNLSARTW